MPKVIKNKFSKLTLNTEEIFKEIDMHELNRRREAAKYATKIMKKNASRKGVSTPGGFPARRTGVFKKKLAYRLVKKDRSAIVGSKSPLAHLLEFGHGDGKERNKRPIVVPSLLQAEPGIIKIMSSRYF